MRRLNKFFIVFCEKCLKKFKKYLINFIVLYIIVSLLVWLCVKVMKNRYKQENITNENYIEEIEYIDYCINSFKQSIDWIKSSERIGK